MKKNLVGQSNLSVVKDLGSHNRQIQKYLALESHPRQKQENIPAYNVTPSVVAMMF